MLHYIVKKLNEKYDLVNFETSEKYRTVCNYLLYKIEQLKIDLSKEKEVVLTIPNPEFTDNKNNPVKAEIVITRDDYNREVGPIFQRSLEICLNLFKENKINPSELDRVLLVGGPTQYPYFREQIKDQLKIDFDISVNPMTAVTVGAAIFGSTRDLPEEVKPEIIEILSKTPADCRLEVNCVNQTLEESEVVTGKVILEDNNYDLVESISITRTDKGWDSGDLQIDPTDGTFASEVLLRKKQPNTFKIIVNGRNGQRFSVTSDEFTILHGVGGTIDHAPYSLNITVKGNKCRKIIQKDAELPAEGMNLFHTTAEIKKDKGSDQAILYIELTEGESENPADNIYIGTLKIPNEELRRDLPIDTELEVFVKEKADRTILATCSIPLTGQSFEAVIEVARSKDDKKKVSEEFENLRSNYIRIKENVDETGIAEWNMKFDQLALDRDISEIEINVNEIKNSGSDDLTLSDTILKVNAMITEAKLKLENFEKEFIFIYTKERIKKMQENLSEKGSDLENKISQLNDQLSHAEEESSVEKAKSVNTELSKYDEKFLGTLFLYYLYCYTLTKSNAFVQDINTLKRVASEKFLYDVVSKVQLIINDWNRDIENKSINCNLVGKFYNRFDYNIRKIFDETENKETYPIPDHDKIATIFNQHTIVFDHTIIDEIAAISGAKKDVLRKAIEFATAYQERKLDLMEIKLDEFKNLYYIDPSVPGSISSDKMPGGPPIQ